MRQANLRGADLGCVLLSDANLQGADLDGAGLAGSNLTRSNLNGASLRRANLYGANLSEARLAGADLTGATSMAPASTKQICAGQLSPALSWPVPISAVRNWIEPFFKKPT